MTEARFEPEPLDAARWDALVTPFRDLALPQCWAYGEARGGEGGWQVERGAILAGGNTIGAAQVLVRSVALVGGGLAWVSRGPLWRREDAEGGAGQLGTVLSALRRYYVSQRKLYLRVGPPIDDGAPLASALADAGFRTTEIAGWASATLDLRRDVAALRAGLDQKWRNALSKAERSPIRVDRGEDDTQIGAFIAEYEGFLARRGFATTVTPALLAALQRHLPPNRKLVAYRASNEAATLGSVLIVRYGRRAEYLAAVSPDAGRAFNVGQLLLWRAICDMKTEGLAYFDVGGMDPLLTPRGIYRYKSGLGGTPYRHMPEIEADDGGWRARLVRQRVMRARSAPAKEGSP